MFERSIGGERDNRSLSAVVRRGNDSVNTTIFLELILVIVGETLEDEMGYDPTFTVPITRSFLEESWDYSSRICAGVVYLVVITRWQNPATAHLVGHDRNPTCHRLAGMLKYFNCPPCEIASQVTHNSLLPVTQWKTLNSRQNSSSPLKGIIQSSSRLNVFF